MERNIFQMYMQKKAIFNIHYRFFMTRDILGKKQDMSFNAVHLKNKCKLYVQYCLLYFILKKTYDNTKILNFLDKLLL